MKRPRKPDMTTIYAIHAPEAEKLTEVMATMRELGAPTIRAVDCGDYLMALEGSHRLAAAAELGLAPKLDILEQDEIVPASEFDWTESLDSGESYTAGELAGEAYSPHQAVAYRIDDDGFRRV